MVKIFVLYFLFLTGILSANEVSKERWITEANTVLPVIFCKPNWYFKQCFNVTQTECEETAASATRICIKSMQDKFPNTFHQPKDGKFWGKKVGECAGTAYEISLTHKRISNDKCNNIDNWSSIK